MEVHEIEVEIDEKGNVRLLVRGLKGGTCLEVTKDLEQALGAEVVAREFTPEAGELNVISASDQIRQRIG